MYKEFSETICKKKKPSWSPLTGLLTLLTATTLKSTHLSRILSTHFKARKNSSVPELWVQDLLGRKLTISSSVMAAEHRVCDEEHKKKQRQSDGAEKHWG